MSSNHHTAWMHVMKNKPLASNPFELAIYAIETKAGTSKNAVAYAEFQQHALALVSGMKPANLNVYVDHAISLLVHSGYLRRLHVGPGHLAYVTTPAWSQRNQLLCTLRAPEAKPRMWRVRRQEANRAEKTRRKLEALAAQQQARESAREEAQRLREERRQQLARERGLTPSGNIRRAPSVRRNATAMGRHA